MPDFTPRPTIYKGVQMRSRLEAGFAAWLDRSRIEWAYEPFAVGDESGQYLPDFVLTDVFFFPLDTTRPDFNEARLEVVVEVKPTAALVDMPRLVRAAQQLRASDKSHFLVLVVADQGTFCVFPNVPEPQTTVADLMPMAWVFDHNPPHNRTLLTWAAEPPFARDWWT